MQSEKLEFEFALEAAWHVISSCYAHARLVLPVLSRVATHLQNPQQPNRLTNPIGLCIPSTILIVTALTLYVSWPGKRSYR